VEGGGEEVGVVHIPTILNDSVSKGKYCAMTRILFTIIAGLALMQCVNNDSYDINQFVDNRSIQTLNGTWKIISFDDHALKKVELPNQDNLRGLEIKITFNDTTKPLSIYGINTTNTINGEFEYIQTRKFKIMNLSTTDVGEPDWGKKFTIAILSKDIEFIISGKRLRVYYNQRVNSMTLEKQ
jgi:hypothetical protein